MKLILLQLEQRIQELEALADEVATLVKEQRSNFAIPPELNTKGQRWYRGAREIFVTQKSSSLAEFEQHYVSVIKDVITSNLMAFDPVTLTEFAMAPGPHGRC
jgi:hypothetical protein